MAIDCFDGKYAFLSNFYERPVSFLGITYQNSEAAFQAQKTLDEELKLKFADLPPNKAKRLGRLIELRPDWEEVKNDVMYQICRIKFFTNKDLAQALLDTGEEELIEGNYWNDTYWGVCNGVGKNQLGKTLMRIRDELYARGEF